ncbi:MAG: undecaprenyl-diphosphate phosphatase [Trueperaceae bacterium]|nr:undecaprenyl-diphosphate phosphatase [Trueperaceae bacterium]
MGDVEAIVLGVVQGLTEFLPISSSGHLVLASYWLGLRAEGASLELAVDIATNTGTFLAVLWVLRRDVARAAAGFLRGLVSPAARGDPGWRLAWLVIIGSVPTAAIGLGLRGVFEHLNAPVPASLALIVTGLILWTAPASGRRDAPQDLTWRDALVVGFAQGLAVMPGISRSGTTIASLLWRDVEAATAARLSFLLYLVASAGVAVLGLTDVREAGFGWRAVALMTVASFLTGWLALTWLFRLLKRGRFRWFAPYLWLIAAATLLRVLLSA